MGLMKIILIVLLVILCSQIICGHFVGALLVHDSRSSQSFHSRPNYFFRKFILLFAKGKINKYFIIIITRPNIIMLDSTAESPQITGINFDKNYSIIKSMADLGVGRKGSDCKAQGRRSSRQPRTRLPAATPSW